jgi:hypothetical protein
MLNAIFSKRNAEIIRNIHPFLISLYIPFYFFFNNRIEISPSSLVVPVIVFFVLSLILWVVAYLSFRSPTKAALATSICLIIIFFHKHIYILLVEITRWPVPYQYFLLVWLLLFLESIVFISCARKKFIEVASLGTGVFAVSTMVVLCLQFGYYYSALAFTPPPKANDILMDFEFDKWNEGNVPPPDIYYIVLDGYGRSDQIRKHYGFDNSAFLTKLREIGFFVGENAISNYRMTNNSLQASLNMDYLHGKKLKYSISSSVTARLLKKLQYKYILIPSGAGITNFSPLADVVFEKDNFLLDDFSFFLFDLSMPGFIWNRVFAKDPRWNKLVTKGFVSSGSDIERWARHITHSFELLAGILDMDGPKFVFAHIISPHPPIVFKSDGSLNTNASMRDFANGDQANPWYSPDLAGQIAHLNRLVQSAVGVIIEKSSRPPIIVLQGDHGTFKTRGPSILGQTEQPLKDQVRERLSILLAIYGPEKFLAKLYDSMSPVNVFRILFNFQFDAELEILPDLSFWSSNDQQVFIDVTEMHHDGSSDLTSQ